MAISKPKKQEIVKELSEKLARQKSLIFVDFTGLKVKDLSVLKAKLKQIGAEFKVAKKTLMSIAFKERSINADPESMAGEVALVMGYQDEVAPAKVISDFTKTSENAKILGGLLENKSLDALQVIELAKLPSRQELLARLAGSLSSPSRNFVNILQSNLRGLLTVMSSIKKEV